MSAVEPDQPPMGDRAIFIIRHGEKPADPSSPPYGVTSEGERNGDSLIPRGWERAGALCGLFAPFAGKPRPGLRVPTELISPGYNDKTKDHRTYQTISAVSDLLGIEIDTTWQESKETALGNALREAGAGMTLVCWEHTRIQAIACAIMQDSIPIPKWCSERFDIVYAFTRAQGGYAFTQIPEMVLPGDSTSPMGQPAAV